MLPVSVYLLWFVNKKYVTYIIYTLHISPESFTRLIDFVTLNSTPDEHNLFITRNTFEHVRAQNPVRERKGPWNPKLILGVR